MNETTLWHKCHIAFTVILPPAGQQCNWFLPNQLSSSLLWSKTFFFSLEFSKPPIFDDPTPKKKKKKKKTFSFL